MMDTLISIVTPSLKQRRSLRETLDSVLSQNYPSLDYIVMDGGSTDKSVELIRARETGISFWQSAPDQGQAAPINQGFQRARWVVFGSLSSDDLFLNQYMRLRAD